MVFKKKMFFIKKKSVFLLFITTSDVTVAVSLWLAVSLWRRAMAAEPRVMTSQAHLKRYDMNHYSIEMRNKRKIKHWIDAET